MGPVGTALKNPRNVMGNFHCTELHKGSSCRCWGKLLQGKISRHLLSVHKNEEVKKFILIPKTQLKGNNRGCFNHSKKNGN